MRLSFIILLASAILLNRKIKEGFYNVKKIREGVYMSSKDKGFFNSYYQTLKIIYISMYILLNRKIRGDIKISNSLSYVSYFYNTETYYFPIVRKRGPKKNILKVIADDNKDITEFIKRLSGPNVDFYNSQIKVKDLNYSKISIQFEDTYKVFDKNSVLLLQ